MMKITKLSKTMTGVFALALVFGGANYSQANAAASKAGASCTKVNQIIKGASPVDNLVCTQSGSKKVLIEQWKQPATLSLLVFKTPNIDESYWVALTADARKAMPNLKIKYLYTPGLDRKAYASQLLTTNQLPDLIWDVPASDFVKAGALLAYPESALSSFQGGETRYSGKVYGLPSGAQAIPLVYYNKTMFTKAGITSTPKTWAEFTADCAALKTAGFTPILAGGAGDAGWVTGIMLQGMVTADVNAKNPKFDQDYVAGKDSLTKSGLATFKNYASLVSGGYFNADWSSISYADVKSKFESGGGAMYPMGSWEAAGTGTGFDIGVFALPSSTGATSVPSIGAVVSQVPFISAKTKYAAQAIKAGIMIAASVAGGDAGAKTDALFPNMKGYTAPASLSVLFKDSYSLYAKSTKVPTFGWNAGMDTLPTAFMSDVATAVQGMMKGTVTAEAAVATLDASMVKNTAR